MDRTDLNALPSGFNAGRFLYAVAFDNGLIKVGCTISPQIRMKAHFDAALRDPAVAARMTGAFVARVHGSHFKAERALLERVRRIGARFKNRREWFTGADPKDVAREVLAVCEATP